MVVNLSPAIFVYIFAQLLFCRSGRFKTQFLMDILQFRDLKVTPDIVHEYKERNGYTPLIIDNGSFGCRAGWATDHSPRLIFRNQLAKPRRDRNKKEGDAPAPVTQIGNDILNIEALRFQLRTQFDRNIVTHFQVQEQIFDYIFKHLGIDTVGQVNHPIVLTEALLNPNYSRQRKKLNFLLP